MQKKKRQQAKEESSIKNSLSDLSLHVSRAETMSDGKVGRRFCGNCLYPPGTL